MAAGIWLGRKPVSVAGPEQAGQPQHQELDGLPQSSETLRARTAGNPDSIGDHRPAHRSKVRTRFLFEQRDWLPIEWLPRYAPDLHPTEGVWNNIQGREMANFCPDHMDEAVTASRRGLQRVRRPRKLSFAFLSHAGLLF